MRPGSGEEPRRYGAPRDPWRQFERAAAADQTVGIVGGSGLYRLLDDVEEVALDTPFGAPSAPVHRGEVEGRPVASWPATDPSTSSRRTGSTTAPTCGSCTTSGSGECSGPCAAGSLQPHLHPGVTVVCAQLVDRTSGRQGTFFDGPEPTHISFADPYCADLRQALLAASAARSVSATDGGTVVVVPGPDSPPGWSPGGSEPRVPTPST